MNTPQITPPRCPACDTPMVLRDKNGEKFWGCIHYKECGGKTIPFREAPKSGGFPKVVNGNEILMDEIQDFRKEINERLDAMGKFLAEKLR